MKARLRQLEFFYNTEHKLIRNDVKPHGFEERIKRFSRMVQVEARKVLEMTVENDDVMHKFVDLFKKAIEEGNFNFELWVKYEIVLLGYISSVEYLANFPGILQLSRSNRCAYVLALEPYCNDKLRLCIALLKWEFDESLNRILIIEKTMTVY